MEHEGHHLEANHYVLQTLWRSATLLDYGLNGGNHEEYTVDEQQKKVLSKLDRAHEAAADRIPAACNDCKLASDFVEWRGGYKRGLIGNFIAKMSNYLRKIDTSSHPSNEKRLQWAKRIYNLKLAEQEIKKNEN